MHGQFVHANVQVSYFLGYLDSYLDTMSMLMSKY
jgi:hypothetical protein